MDVSADDGEAERGDIGFPGSGDLGRILAQVLFEFPEQVGFYIESVPDAAEAGMLAGEGEIFV